MKLINLRVDWAEAPEGTTHFSVTMDWGKVVTVDGRMQGYWEKHLDGKVYYWSKCNSNGGAWMYHTMVSNLSDEYSDPRVERKENE